MDFRYGRNFDFEVAAAFTAELVRGVARNPIPDDTLVNVNCPAGTPLGVEVTHLGKRVYDDELRLVEEDGDGSRRRYEIYGIEPSFEDEEGSDLSAIANGRISVSTLHFDLTDRAGLETLRSWKLDAMLDAAGAALADGDGAAPASTGDASR